MERKFCDLSTLVLVDILAALPMEHVVRLARLGHENLRQGCFLKWVTDRMTEITFKTVIRAHQTGDGVAAKLCADSVIKRLKGKLVISRCDFGRVGYMDTCLSLLKGVT